MLRFLDSGKTTTRLGRREFLRIGGLGLGALTLSDMIALQAAVKRGNSAVKDKSVIFLFMHGGPSQFETFDPKMDAAAEIRSTTGEIKTALPGITFGSTFQKLAPLADKFSIVRSFVTGDGVHDIKTIMGKDTLKANVGSLLQSHRWAAEPHHGDAYERGTLSSRCRPTVHASVSQVRRFHVEW